MKESIFAIRLREARKAAKLSLASLAEQMDHKVTRQCLSRYEQGDMCPKSDALMVLAKALNISLSYFDGTNLSINLPMLRTSLNGKLSDEELIAIEALLAYKTEQYLQLEANNHLNISFMNPLDHLNITSSESVMDAADQLRLAWQCGDGPIPSIIRLLERKGIKLFEATLPDGVMGLSTWADEKHPLILIDSRPEKTTIERLRFTVGHELGHLLLHISPELDEERICNRFASFFLFPKQTFIEEMGGAKRQSLTLDELIDLREVYGVSIAAQVHAAKDLGMISIEHYNWWYDKMINKNRKEVGWGQYRFPETLGREKRLRARSKKQI